MSDESQDLTLKTAPTNGIGPAAYAHLVNDPEVEEQGIWWEDPESPSEAPLRILISYRGSRKIEQYFNRLLMKQASLIQSGTTAASQYTEECELRALAKCCRDWEHVPDPDRLMEGKVEFMDCSEPNAFRILSHPHWRRLRRVVAAIARNDDRYVESPESAARAVAPNSDARSAGA